MRGIVTVEGGRLLFEDAIQSGRTNNITQFLEDGFPSSPRVSQFASPADAILLPECDKRLTFLYADAGLGMYTIIPAPFAAVPATTLTEIACHWSSLDKG